ncbi:hypothetical protein AJ79_06873 [Helicocarpus griseus UAMH5409]|uniref:Uncharacterized protein n=1 Tax=Helicocarpus griseus UAMH5409 TaxID=1447875 RepID=A0A2B7X835_9EURO|nr:hypothetical protein AJ79_06873 [Helicocarpus griseus UAMH5409]
MHQKLMGASVSLLVITFLFYFLHLLRSYWGDTFPIQNAATLNCLRNSLENTCPAITNQYYHDYTVDEEIWKTKRPAPQRPWTSNILDRKTFRTVTLSSVRRIETFLFSNSLLDPLIYPYGSWQSNHQQNRKQHPRPSSQISPIGRSTKNSRSRHPRLYNHANNDNNKNKQTIPSRLETSVHAFPLVDHPANGNPSPPGTEDIPPSTPICDEQHEQKGQRPLLHHSNGNSSAISQSKTSLGDLYPHKGNPLDLLYTLLAPLKEHIHPSSASENNSTKSAAPSISGSAGTTAMGTSSRDTDIRGSFLGMVIGVVVGVMWF